ncbi:tRNA 2'-phosphotransferase 1 [Zea mays]|uniref:2'-phosphotransferase n=3 Tax=Zea mays TaxID=4577 RepID=A0A3L6EGM6_MAIZE|nr:tRNA 2'-phosphotransferase 1 [Zea mays]
MGLSHGPIAVYSPSHISKGPRPRALSVISRSPSSPHRTHPVAAAASPPLLLLSRHPRRAGLTNWSSLPRGQNAGSTAPPAATASKPAAPLTVNLPRQVARISTPHLRPAAAPPRCPDRVRALAGCLRKTLPLLRHCRYLPAPTPHLRFAMNPSSSSTSSSGGYHSRAAAFASPQPRGGGGGGGGGRDGSDRIDALGRLLTRVLRHMAAELRLDMRTDGYVRVRDLLKLNLQTFAKVPLKSHTVDEIREAVRRDNKQRFSLLEEDGELLIRANQGHTISTVTSESLLKPILSPDEVSVCVHGTYRKNLDSILQFGLKRMARLHVHFSSGLPSDGEVTSGVRQNVNILIHLDVSKALKGGMKLYISDNKVILTEGFDGVVPVKYFERVETWPGRAPIPFQR